MQAFFDKCRKTEVAQAEEFSRQFDVTLEKLPNIPGESGDYVVTKGSYPKFPEGTIIEFKFDKTSLKTGNIFLEFEQTRDCWFSTKESGIKKALSQNQIVVITIPTNTGSGSYLLKDITDYDMLVASSHRTCTTRSGSNGNHNGCYTRGHLVCVKYLEPLESY